MDGTELGRQVQRLRAQAKAQRKLALLARERSRQAGTSAADCLRRAWEPSRRLEPLRRQVGATHSALR